LSSKYLGVGLASALSVLTIMLTVTGRLQLYITTSQAWFACGMSVLILLGSVAAVAIRPTDHDHDHDHGSSSRAGAVAGAVGAAVAAVVAIGALILPPATLSAELAMERDTGTPPLFAGADDVQLGVVDTSTFGVGDWSAVFATATSPERYAGQTVTLTGFMTNGSLSRLVITHCVVDAQTASLPLDGDVSGLETGDWVEVTGDVEIDADGRLVVTATGITPIDEPEDPYEY
jgi:uncharacterized repeat protein (TIGR03943 family)